MHYKCNQEQFKICENNSICHLCDGNNRFKKPKYLILREKEKVRKEAKIAKKKKEGMSFEKAVAKKINRRLGSPQPRTVARRRPNSGAIWHMPGDIVTPEQLLECKERGSTNARGESQITIPRDHLEKVRQEAIQSDRVPYYVFTYKNHPETYVVKNFDDELDLLQQIQILKDRILELEAEHET